MAQCLGTPASCWCRQCRFYQRGFYACQRTAPRAFGGKGKFNADLVEYSDDQQKELIKQFVESQLINTFKSVPLSKFEKDKLIKEIIQEAKGYGPLDPLLEDPTISDILVNGANNVFVEKGGSFIAQALRLRIISI